MDIGWVTEGETRGSRIGLFAANRGKRRMKILILVSEAGKVAD